ncbi:MAG: energy transducer TonB [Proteobacteria bacterium]|nr:energy transducer TonB [Pseudomonadota bacterium]
MSVVLPPTEPWLVPATPWRWASAALLVVLLHAGVVLILMRQPAAPEPPGLEPALMVELAPPEPAQKPAEEPEPEPTAEPPVAKAPPEPVVEPPKPVPPEPEPVMQPQPETPPEPEPLPDPPPMPPAPVRPAVAVPPKPAPRPPRPVRQPVIETPSTAAPTPQPTIAPQKQAQAANSAGSPTWQARLLAHLNRFKRYPPAAQMRRKEGTALVRFRLMPDGSAQAVRLVTASGTDSLDEEATALISRAQPLPRPDDNNQPIELVVPIQFLLR